MSLIKNSVSPQIYQRPKAVPGHTFNEKGFPHHQAGRTIRYTYTTSPRRLNMLSETNLKYNMYVEWVSRGWVLYPIVLHLKLACSLSD